MTHKNARPKIALRNKINVERL